jgi:sialate O-acetylesterase
MNLRRLPILAAGLLVSMSALAGAAEVRFARHHTDHMVLQRDKPVTIRGFADEAAKVTVTFAGQTKATQADGHGAWSVTLDPMPANSQGGELVAASAGSKAKLGDVVVGDVLLFARQTTIDVSLGRDAAGRRAAADLPSVRILTIRTLPAEVPQQDLAEQAVTGWTALDKKAALGMNATAFYAARGIAKDVGVPMGIIDLNLGHHFPIAWLSREALLQTTEVFGAKATHVQTTMDNMAKALAQFEDEAARKKADAARGYPASHPREDGRYPAAGYNAVLHPMRGLALKGLVLQLGNDYPYVLYEDLVRRGNNTRRAHLGQAYKDTYSMRKWCLYVEPLTTPRIPRQWRRVFGDDALPVGWIAPPGSDLVTLGRHHYEMRELQRRVAEKESGVDLILPGTEHIPFSAQPADEALLGARCLAWLRGAVYRKSGVVPTGPVFDRLEANYSAAQVFFKPGTAQGLKAAPGALDHFEVAGVDLNYAPAKARIDGQTIRLQSDTVSRIAHVRYNWTLKPDQGLTSASGLPAFPFNTDGHAYPRTINTLGEEVLPVEFATPIPQWKSRGAVIVKGSLNKSLKAGNYLGPTGLRVSPFGPNLYVNSAYLGSPADGKILPGDYIYAVNGELFGDEMFKQVAAAITEAETEEGQGRISFDVMRDGEKMTVELKLEVLGAFSPTSPYDCAKTDRIVANAEAFLAEYGGVVPGHPVFSNADAMFLLAAGSPEYQGLVRRHVYNRMAKRDISKPIRPDGREVQGGGWDLSADILLVAEYYLATGDRNVLPHLKYWCDSLTAVQIRPLEEKGPWPQVQPGQTGGWRHNFYGGATYGTMPAIQVPATLGYHLAKEAGVAYDWVGYERAVNWFLHNGAKVAQVGYGYHAKPVTAGNTIDPDDLAAGMLNPGNGGVGGAALVFGLRGNGPVARTCSFVATHCYNNTAYAHGGHFWVNFYNPLGAKVHSKKAFQFFMKHNRWYQELHRMHNHSRQQDRVFGAGQFLAYTAPRERLRILGAHESVFAPDPPQALRDALAAYHNRDYAACEEAAAALIAKGDTHGLDLQKAEQLRDAAALILKSIAHDLAKVKRLIADHKPYEASLDLAQLKAVAPVGNTQLAAMEKQLSDPALQQAMAQDKGRYSAHIKSLALQYPTITEKDGGAPWQSLVSRADLKQQPEDAKATVWRMKVLESLAAAPEGWTENDFDDSAWVQTTMPISWHTNHTAVFRAPFQIADKRAVKALRLHQWAFRQEDVQVFINGELVAKITPSGSGGQEITVPLNDHALQLLQTGRNTLAATYKNTWRWGRYFRNEETARNNSVYNSGVHLTLEMTEQAE